MSNHIDKGNGFTHHDDTDCCECLCKDQGRYELTAEDVLIDEIECIADDAHGGLSDVEWADKYGNRHWLAVVRELIRAYTNAEIAKVLDRLESNKETLYWWTGGEYDKTTAVDMRAIAAERNKLKESK